MRKLRSEEAEMVRTSGRLDGERCKASSHEFRFPVDQRTAEASFIAVANNELKELVEVNPEEAEQIYLAAFLAVFGGSAR